MTTRIRIRLAEWLEDVGLDVLLRACEWLRDGDDGPEDSDDEVTHASLGGVAFRRPRCAICGSLCDLTIRGGADTTTRVTAACAEHGAEVLHFDAPMPDAQAAAVIDRMRPHARRLS
jgi:hypothetical protein